MLKLKNAISRYTNKASKSRRSSSVIQNPLDSDHLNDSQAIQVYLEELTDIEKTQFILWWNDLNPFDLNELENTKTLEFLSKFELPGNKLEEIISLFRDQKKGLNREQFFAVLRLIGHAQKDKRINPAYIHIGGKQKTGYILVESLTICI
ncbi:hypothetical protein K501DRAFT_185175 [Backusella circina FSU 941]|nr:hypothetical protein K501DRAFT_185175 [Backusella circina FSU 941]